MADNSEKIALFKEAVQQQVDEEINGIISAANKKAAEIIKNAEDEWINESYRIIQGKSKEIRREHQKKLSQASFNASKEVFIQRSRLTEEFFSDIYDKLKNYSLTNAYKEQLAEDAEKVNSQKPFCKNVTAYVKLEDKEFAAEFFSKKYPSVIVKTDKNIKLGGITFFYPDDNTYIDKTLDGAFTAEKEAFVNNAEIKLPE